MAFFVRSVRAELRIYLGLGDPRPDPGRVPVRLHIDDNAGRVYVEKFRCQSPVHVQRYRQHVFPFAMPRRGVGAHGIVFRVPFPTRNVRGI